MELAMKRQMKYALIAIFSVIAFVAAIYQGFSSVHAESLETASPRSLYLQRGGRPYYCGCSGQKSGEHLARN
jgi:hypothetical protein